MSKLKALLGRNRLMHALMNLEGNARVCIYTEPMWGIPVNLYLPLMAMYMGALGLDPLQIGVVATVNLLSQMVSSFFSGAITDKFGRRWTTAIVDFFCWAVPFLIWMNAQGLGWFIVAAVLNGTWRITENSWGLLMVEDAPPRMLVSIYSLSTIAGLLSGFFSPLTSLLVGRFSLVNTMRGLFLFAFVFMVSKIILLQIFTHETAAGEKRKTQLKGRSVFHAVKGSFTVLRVMLKRKPLMLVLGILSCIMVIRSATDNFWPLLLTQKLGVSEESLPLLSGLRSLSMLAFFFVLSHRLDARRFYKPILAGLFLLAGIHLMLFLLPASASWVVFPGVVAEALALSITIPLFSSLQMLLLDHEERARMFGFSLSFCLMVTAPFGALNGLLSTWALNLPMLLSFLLSVLALFLLTRLRHEMHGVEFDDV